VNNTEKYSVAAIGLVPAFLVEWVDEGGNVVRIQTMSGFPGTQLVEHPRWRQRMAAKALGRDFEEAHKNLLDMLDRADKRLGDFVRRQS